MSRPFRQIFWLLLILVFQRAELFAKSQHGAQTEPGPPRRVLHLDASEAASLKADLRAQGVEVLPAAQAQALFDRQLYAQTPPRHSDDASADPEQDRLESYRSNERPAPAYQPAPRFNFNLGFHFNGPIRGGNDDAVALFFVVVGLVVVFAFVAYSVTYLYRYLAHGYRGQGWFELGVGAWGFANAQEFGGLKAARIGMGLKERGFSWGLGAELGRIDATLSLEPKDQAKDLALSGAYAAAGPRLNYATDWGPQWTLEFLAGTSEHPEVHLLAKAMLGLRWRYGSGLYFGLSTGSLMVSLKSNLGYVRQQNPYNWLSGAETGWRF
ncbi:MAG: hypothetical protein RRB13_07795 [bacterium]|nr:hypothetical protein [bacterium]